MSDGIDVDMVRGVEPPTEPYGETFARITRERAEPDTVALTKRELNALKHCLGSTRGKPGWRNHFYAAPSDPVMLSLVGKGLMVRNATQDSKLGGNYFHATDAGKAWLDVPTGGES